MTAMLEKNLQGLFTAVSSGPVYRFLSKVMRSLNRIIRISPAHTVLVGKHKMRGGSFDRVVALNLWKRGFLEGYESSLIAGLAAPGMTVLDIGANIGYYTLILASRVGEAGKVYAFEPDPENYAMLKENLELNGYRNVVAVQRAVSDSKGKVTLFKNAGNRGDHSLFHDGRADVDRVEVEMTAIDDLIPAGTRVDLIKMDIQGAEIKALKGMRRVVSENREIKIITELMPQHYRASDVLPEDAVKTVFSCNDMTVSLIDERRRQLLPLSKADVADMCRKGRSVNILIERGACRN